MRLLYLTRSHTGHDARWLRVLAGRGLQVGFLPLQAVDSTSFSREHPGVDLLASPMMRSNAGTTLLEAATARVGLQIRAWNPDVIVAGPLTDAGYLAMRIAPERTLLMSWAFDVLHEAIVDSAAADRVRVTLAAAHYVFADCEAVLAHCEALAGRRFRQACVVPWGLSEADKPEPHLGWRQRFGAEKSKVVLCPRGFSPVYRPEVVVASFAQAFARNESLRLWLAGSDGLQSPVEQMVNDLGLRGVVRFLGRLNQADLAGCFAEADVYLSCADSDGTSISLLQAMYAGLPCVVTDLPSNHEWLEPMGGWFAAAGRSEEFSRGLSEAADLSPAARAQIAASHRARVGQRADLAANLPRLLQTIETIAGRIPIHSRQPVAP